MRRSIYEITCLLLLLVLGCRGESEYGLAPVSGTVTMDGKPLPDATVVFFPELSEDTLNAGPPSMGITGQNGRFTLSSSRGGDEGAVIGPHRVTITTENVDDNDRVIKRETVPPRYNARSDLKFDVPREGTDKADFVLESK